MLKVQALQQDNALLKKKIERLEFALEATQEGMLDFDPSKGTCYFSDRYYTMLGYAPNEFPVGYEAWVSMLHPDDREETINALEKFLAASHGSSSLEFRMRAKNGDYRWILARIKAFERDEQGNLTRVVGTHLDITDKKQLEGSLHLARFVFEKAPIGIYRFGRDAKIIDVNDQAAEMLGYSKDELRSMTLFDIDPTIEELEEEEWNALVGRRITYIESLHQHKDGRQIPVSITTNFLAFEGRQFAISFVVDITERKRAEQSLLQSQKMEAIGTLAGGISHDFNNILSGILGYAELAKLNSPENSKAQKYTARIIEASHRAKELITQILYFSRQHSPEKQPVVISEICKEAFKLIKATIPASIKIQDFFATTQARVNGNPAQIHQVVVNLCTNAAHAMKNQGGELALELIPIEIGTSDQSAFPNLPPGNYLNLIVTDTGSGIPQDILPRIFDPYFTTKEIGEGTGMGLATVHGIVKDHGGDIKVYSETGVGTSFHVFFPTIDDIAVRSDETAMPLAAGSEHILLVDDEMFIVDIEREMLSALGYTVEVQTDPQEALKVFGRQPEKYDLVVTDWTMPKMSGRELICELKKIRPAIPIILCTGFDKRLLSKGKASVEANAVLMKPITMNILAQTVKDILASREKES